MSDAPTDPALSFHLTEDGDYKLSQGAEKAFAEDPSRVVSLQIGKDGHLWMRIKGKWCRVVTEVPE